MRSLVLTLFFFSGAFGLFYQIVWVRMLTQVFGTTAEAVGVVLAAFMSGLALGSWLLGKVADHNNNLLRFYAVLEIGIGLSALAVHYLLVQIAPAYLAFYDITGQSETMLSLSRFVLAFVLVMLPTFLMGATLPVLARFIIRRLSVAGADLSTLYAVNTTGAVAGVVVCGFYLIAAYGTNITVYIAVAGNVVLGIIAWLASVRAESLELKSSYGNVRSGTDPPVDEVLSPRLYFLLLLALGVSGMTSFAYEIYWTRSLVFVLGNSTYALSTMLTAFIAGIALGGYVARLFIDRISDRLALFGWLQILIAVSAAIALPVLFALVEPQAVRSFLGQSVDEVGQLNFARFGIALLVMLVPAALIGATFPLVGRTGVTHLQDTGRRIGLVYASNTFGNVAGALLPGFVLLNWFGIQHGILLMAVLNAVIGLAFLVLRAGADHRLRWAIPFVIVCVLLVLTRIPLDFQFPTENERDEHQTLFYRDGPSATTKVTFDPRTGDKIMAIDGIVIGGTTFTEYKQLLLAHLPKLLKRDVSNELSIGLGSGILVGESILHNRVDEVTVVEIEPSVVEGAALFARENHNVLSSPRVRIVIDDIGNFLRTTSDLYDVISADEKTSLEYASNGFSYSLEYYQLLRQHLKQRGMVIQWVPANMPPGQYKMVLRTFAESFPYVRMGFFMPALRMSGYNTILIGSREEINFDIHYMTEILHDEHENFAGLMRYGLTTPESILAQFVAEGEIIRRAVQDAPLNTLVHPRYEFFSPGDYAMPQAQRVATNISFISALRRAAHDELLAVIEAQAPDRTNKIRRALAAEQAYLEGYRISLGPVSAGDIFHQYDTALSLAPWNDSLRERIALHYREIAQSQTNLKFRAILLQRARAARAGKQ